MGSAGKYPDPRNLMLPVSALELRGARGDFLYSGKVSCLADSNGGIELNVS